MVQGNYKPEFQKIYDIFNDQINSDYELGAGISIEYKGELIVDLFGGFKSESKTTKWTKDTLVNVWSVTKAVTGICILKLISDGKLDVNKLVSDYWPEYGCNGKEAHQCHKRCKFNQPPETDKGCGILNDDAGVLHSNKGEEKANARGHSKFEVAWNRVNEPSAYGQ